MADENEPSEGEQPAADVPANDSSSSGVPSLSDQLNERAAAQVVAEAEAVVADSALGAQADPLAEALPTEISEDAIVTLIAERDEYLEALQRLKAEFANARRRNTEQALVQRKQAAAELVEKLLPVLDSCDAAVGHGMTEVEPIAGALFEVLKGQGLERVDPVGLPFDPELHEAVMHEDGEGEPTVAQTLRPGYSWNERVIRPAMVKVRG